MSHVKGNRVSWIETYKTTSNVLSQRVCWGTIISSQYQPGNSDGFAIAGTYLTIMPVGGGGSILLYDGHVLSAAKD